MKIMLLGDKGQIGAELAKKLTSIGHLKSFNRTNLPLENISLLKKTIQNIHPDMIINASAYTNVNMAEVERELTYFINRDIVRVLAMQAKKVNAWLIHYSSDYVFDGRGEKPYLETDKPSPLNIYGKSKWEGEKAIQSSGCKHFIFRTSWIYSERKHNFLKIIIDKLKSPETFNVVTDQIGSPTSSHLAAEITKHCMIKAMQEKNNCTNLSGVYHLSAIGHTSWYGFAAYVLKLLNNISPAYKIAQKKIKPIKSESYLSPAKRPMNSKLNNDKIQKTFNCKLPHWQKGVKPILELVLKNHESS